MTLRLPLSLSALTLCLAVMTTAPAAQARTDVTPYIELDQTFVANLKGGSDNVLTYTSAAIGVDASVSTPRTEAVASLRYEHQFGWGKSAPDSDILSGIARARHSLIQDKLSIEGGALATRVRTDGFSSANGSLVTAGDAVSHIYSLYAGPTLTSHVGDVSLNAAYRIGYTRVEDDVNVSFGGIPALGLFDESVYQSATASAGMQPGPLPVGWSVGVGYDREDATELDQRYEDKWGRIDLTYPISRTLALVGGVGYEDIEISQRAALLDGSGNPVLSSKGRLISDTSVPRLISYDVEGLIWDAGVLWRPSRRTSLEARVGRRYDSMHYIGSFSWRASPSSLLEIGYFDRIDSFGRALHGSLIALPTAGFEAPRNPFSGDLTGCASGENGGTCFNDALAAINGSNYRHRGIAALYSRTERRWNWGLGLGYSQRKFLTPDSSIFASYDGAKDEYYYANLFGGVKLDLNSSLGSSLYASHLDAGLGGVDVTNYGSYVTYDRLFGRRLSARASLGLDAIDTSDLETIITLLGQVGLRYQF
tara:strand:+ start:85872 stop:87479 length:1608 start_codon:yes stop_codon:yes gene_type:complete